MKILWFTNTPSGASDYINEKIYTGGWLQSIEKELSKRSDVQLHVAFYSKRKFDPFTQNNVEYHPIHRKSTETKFHKFIKRLRKNDNNDTEEVKILLKLVEQLNPDIIHIHGSEENFGLISKYYKKNLVISIQGIVNAINENLYSGIPKNVIKKYEGLSSKLVLNSDNFRYKRSTHRAEREKVILKEIKFCIGRTKWDERVVKVLSPNINYFLCHEIMRASFYTNQWNKKEFRKKLRLVTISSDKFYKGFETIVKTAQIIKDELQLDFDWQIIGLNEQSKSVNVVTKWLNIDLGKLSIKLVGYQTEKELISVMCESDIYCQVSHIENSPNGLCEAMLLGMPIVSTLAGGTASLLENNKEGLIVQEGEPYSIAGAINELYMDFQKASLFGANARLKASTRHDRNKISNCMISIYEDIVDQYNET